MASIKRFVLIFLFLPLLSTAPCFGRSSTPTALALKASAKKSMCANRGPLIVLDAGHGGSDEGARVRQIQEKKLALATVLYTKKFLEEMGYRVLLTRGKDTYVSLPKRVAMANKIKSELFVSIHFNSAPNTGAQGVEIYYYNDRDPQRAKSSRKLASYILHYVVDQTEASSRGVKVGNIHVIRETTMPAVLIEGGFMTNYTELQNLRKRGYLEGIARGTAQGIDRYFKTLK